jgi:hypothetical protein
VSRSRFDRDAVIAWAIVLGTAFLMFCLATSCALLQSARSAGTVAAGAAGGAALGASAGPLGAAAGGAVGAVGAHLLDQNASLRTGELAGEQAVAKRPTGRIVLPDGTLLDGITGEVFPLAQLDRGIDWLRWAGTFAIVAVGLKLFGQRYRSLVWGALKALFTLRLPTAAKRAWIAGGAGHSR